MLGLRFNTIGISYGMKYSLPSREIIAYSIETIMNGQHYDANISIAGCDKNLPRCLMGMIRLNMPSIMIYGGSTSTGIFKNKKVDVVNAFQSYGEYLKKNITFKERNNLIKSCFPGPESSGGMYTANTMAAAIEAMGMILPNGSSNIALSYEKENEIFNELPYAIYNLLEKNINPTYIITKKSLYNAIITMISLGWGTSMPEMLKPTSAISEYGLNGLVAFLRDRWKIFGRVSRFYYRAYIT